MGVLSLLLRGGKRRASLPTTIELLALQKSWQVRYIPKSADPDHSRQIELKAAPPDIIFLTEGDSYYGRKLLIEWLKKQAKFHLVNQLKALSIQTKLSFQSTTIRDQRTRWGSCSSKQSISLNYKLLFLPSNLVKHVMLHELCHTEHLNHSKQFWNLLAKFDPDLKRHKQEILIARRYIPEWILR